MATADAYSTDKALLYPDRIDGIRAGGPIAPPVHVQLILSDWCNQNCSFCSYRMEGYTSNAMFGVETEAGRDNNPRRFMPADRAREIIDDCAYMGVRAFQVTGGGEPTMHPEWAAILRYAQERGLVTAMVTNGSHLPEAEDETLMRLAWIRVSLDAGSSETYAAIRQTSPAMFHKVLGNLRRLRERRGHAQTPVIGVGFVVTPDNWLDVIDAVKLAKNNGADNVRIGCMFNQEDDAPYAKIRDEAAALCQHAEEMSSPDFRVINRFEEKLGELASGHPVRKLCGYQYLTTYIGADMNVYRCCVYAYHPHGLLGSLKDQPLSAFWGGLAHMERLHGFDGRACERCQFTQINRVIDAAVSRQPTVHDGFV
jgi:MoaA/NifB/PqqE/SkfB family radical SAM enzyme